MMESYKVFALADERDRILDINSDAFLTETAGWVQIDEGVGDRYHHAQGNYLAGPKYDERGTPRYKLVDGKAQERTPEEIDADYTPPEIIKTNAELQAENELLRAQVQSLSDRGEFIEDCIAEMAMQVYV